jgi:phosphate transport system substrate-binding protein
MHIVNPGRGAKIAYPISTFTYAIMQPTDPLGNGAELKSFVNYAINAGQSLAPRLDFVKLPSNIHAADQAAVNLIH